MLNMNGKRILVTGGAGFLGSHMCDAVIDRGAHVFCIDDLSNGKLHNVELLKDHPRFSFSKADINDLRSARRVFKRAQPHYVMHYAAMVGVKRTSKDPLGVYKDFEGIQNIAELSREYGVKKILFTSSSEVYGEPLTTPTGENDRLGSQWPYGIVKIMGEQYLRAFAADAKIPVTVLRFFNVYGPRQDFGESGFVVPIFLNNALEGKPVILFGGGRQTRDFVYIEDHIRLSLKAFCNPRVDGKPMNIGSGRSITIAKLARTISSLGLDVKTVSRPLRSRGEIKYRVPSVSFMRTALRDYPKMPLRDGLGLTLEYMKNLRAKKI